MHPIQRKIPWLLGVVLTLLLTACGGQTSGGSGGGEGGGSGSPSQVTVKVLDPSGSGYTGYYQDSNQNNWQPLNFTNNQATFNVSGSRYGVAVVCSGSGPIDFVLATVSESNLATLSCPGYSAPPAGPTITVTVDASQIASVVAPGDEVIVNDSYPPSTLNSALKSIVSYQKSASGAVDLAVQIRQANRGPTKAVKVVRNVTSSNPTITFVPSDLTNAQSVALTNPPPASFSQYVGYGYITASNTGIADLRVSNNSYLPVAGFQSGDRYISFTEAVQGDYFTDGDGQRAITFKGYTTPPTSVAFATPWSTGALSSNAAGLPQISGLSYPGAIAYGVSYSTPSGRSLSVLVSSGYLAGATSFDLASLSPLLNSVGYTAPSSGTNAVVEVSALVSPMGLRRSLEFISFFGTPTSLPLFTSDLDIQLVNVNKKYVVGGGAVSFP